MNDTGLPDASFEESLQALQQIVGELEGGAITLDESLRRFEEGIGLLRECHQFLERAEQRIEQLVTLDAQGNVTLAPFDATATVDKQTKPAAKKRPARAKEPEPPPLSDAGTDDNDSLDKFLF